MPDASTRCTCAGLPLSTSDTELGLMVVVGGNLAETCLLSAPIEVVKIGGFAGALNLWAGLGDGDDAALILEWKGFEEHAIDAAEDGGRGSNAEGQGEDDRDGESRRLAQLAGGIAKITQQALHRFS